MTMLLSDMTLPDYNSAEVSDLLAGAIDMHCHSGPSVMPRALDHIEALRDAGENRMRAVLIKDHYYSATPTTVLLNKHFPDIKVTLYSGVPLNNTSGGFNRYAVDHGIKLGAKIIWMPTFSSANHIDHHRKEGFPETKMKMLEPTPLTALTDGGKLRDEILPILDLIADNDVILSGGHLHVFEIMVLFKEALRRGVKRLLVNHPSFVVDASHAQVNELAGMGAYIEHSICMFMPETSRRLFDADELQRLIDAAGVGKTILGSDLGQVGNPWPAQGFRRVIAMCMAMGFSNDQIRQMIARNPAAILGLPSD